MRNPLHAPLALAILALLGVLAVGCLTIGGVIVYRHWVDAASSRNMAAIETR